MPDPCFIAARSKADGKMLWKVDLPTGPTLGGRSLDRHRRAFVTLQDGSLVGIGE